MSSKKLKIFTGFFDNGQKLSEEHYRDGVRIGKFEGWFKNGTKKLEYYYNENKLLMNGEKTILLVSCPNKLRNLANDIKIRAGDIIIEQFDSIKILGYILTNKLSYDKYISSMISKVNLRLYTL